MGRSSSSGDSAMRLFDRAYFSGLLGPRGRRRNLLGPLRTPINGQGERVARTVRIVSRCTFHEPWTISVDSPRNLQRLKNRAYDLASWPGVNRTVADKSPATPFSSSTTSHNARRYISLCVPTRSPNSGHYLSAAGVNVIRNRRDRARVDLAAISAPPDDCD